MSVAQCEPSISGTTKIVTGGFDTKNRYKIKASHFMIYISGAARLFKNNKQ